MNLHQWAPLQVHVRQHECPVDIEDPLSKSRLAPVKIKHLLSKPEVRFRIQMGRIQSGNIADSHHFNPDPDPAFHFQANPDPDPAPHQSNGNLQPLVCRHSMALFSASRPPL